MIKILRFAAFLACVAASLLVVACAAALPNTKAAETPAFVAAHRGYSLAAPENTLPAFEAAYRAGADAIEFDMQVTRDNHVVIMHDRSVNRTTNGKGKIADLRLAQIKKLDAGFRFWPKFKGTKVPTLDGLLHFVKTHAPLDMFAEIKHYRTPADIGLMIEPILKQGLVTRTVVTAFSPSDLRAVRRMSNTIGIGYLCPSKRSTLHAFQWARYDPNTWVLANASVLVKHPELIHQALKEHIRLVAWTVNREDQVDALEMSGVHRFVTDNPTLIERTH
jgi:glycerophosphoryl diester phosphodiesterase